MNTLRQRDWMPLILALSLIALWAALAHLTGTSFFGHAFYDTYTRQALAWRQGLLHLPEDVPYLELAIFEDQFYVSFPPFPSVVLFPLTFLFGIETPDNLLVKCYALGACLMMYRALRRAGYTRLSGGGMAFFFCAATSLLPLTLNGAVWYHAQVLAFFLTVAAICLLTLDRPTWALFLYALSVGCRPMNALYALPLFAVYGRISAKAGVSFREMARSLLPGIGLGLLVALGLGAYNAVRFGDPLEFGHNYLPEFSFQGGIQFSLSHVGNNVKTFLLGLPLAWREEGLSFQSFGYSMLIACPPLTMMIVWCVRDIVKKTFSWEKAAVLAACAIQLFLLLLHRTFGGYQLGARYAVDLLPYAFFYLLLTPEKKKMTGWEAAFFFLSFALTVWGVTRVHI